MAAEKRKHFISVIVPVYNGEGCLEECLASIENQTLEEIEIICVDDASTDGSRRILEEHRKRDPRIEVLGNETNKGAYASRNLGLGIAGGKYVYFMDADDWLDGNALELCFRQMESDGLDILYFGLEAFFESDELRNKAGFCYPRRQFYPDIVSGPELFQLFSRSGDHRVNLPGALFHRGFLTKHGLRFNEHPNHMDDLFYFQSILLAERVKCLPDGFYHRRVREGSLMTLAKGKKNMMARLISYCEMHKFLCREKNRSGSPALFYEYVLGYYRSSVELCSKIVCTGEGRKELMGTAFEEPIYNAVFQGILQAALQGGTKTYGMYDHYFPYHLFSKGERIAIYGAGNIGCQFYRQAVRYGDVEIVAIVDANTEKKYPGDIPVESVEALVEKDFDSILVSIHDFDIAREAKRILVSMGIQAECIKWDGRSYYQDEYWPSYLKRLRALQQQVLE